RESRSISWNAGNDRPTSAPFLMTLESCTSSFGLVMGRLRKIKACRRVKIAVFAPIPSVSVRIATKAKPGDCRSRRHASLRSCRTASIIEDPKASLARRRCVPRWPFGPDVAGCRLNRNWPLQRESRDARGRRARRWRLMVCGRRTPHLVPAHVRGHVLVESREFAVGPILVEDVELQGVTLDPEIVEG